MPSTSHRAQIFSRNVRIKLTPIEVGEIMRAWMENVNVSRLTPELSRKMDERRRPVRAMLAQRNRKASEAMWNDDYLRARELLLANGLPDWILLDNEAARKTARNRKEMQANALSTSVLKIEAQKYNGTHWSTVK